MSFETVVRPVVLPNIRPGPAQSQPPADAPDKGVCTIQGGAGKFLDLAYSWSASTSQSHPRENKRRVDVARIYQQTDDGSVNRDNFVDVEVANKIWMNDGTTDSRYGYAPVQADDNIEIREKNKIKVRPE